MKHVRLITMAIGLSIATTGLSTISASEQQLNPKGITIRLPDQIPWKRNVAGSNELTPGNNETAVLYGDPTKSGTYVYQSKSQFQEHAALAPRGANGDHIVRYALLRAR